MHKPLVKICGITRAADAALAAEAGADYLGLNFFRGPRKINYQTVHDLALPKQLELVGLAEYPAPGDAAFADIILRTDISTFQLYSDHYPPRAAHGACRVWLVASVDDRAALGRIGQTLQALEWKPQAVVLDSRVGGQIGGTGRRLDWKLIAEAQAAGELATWPPLVLAGGLTPENVAEAVRLVRPWAVDVSSGVEVPGRPGIKDPAKVRDFVAAAKGA